MNLLRLLVVLSCLFPQLQLVKVGDSITAAHEYLWPIGEGNYNLAGNPYADAVEVYGWSFARESDLATSGWTTRDVALALQRDNQLDHAGPGTVAIVMIGTNDPPEWVDTGFSLTMLREVVNGVQQHGARVVLWTIPPNVNKPVEPFNALVWQVAQEYSVEVIDYHGAMVSLPNAGASPDGVHPSTPPDGQVATFDSTHLQYGYTLRNYLALRWLHENAIPGEVCTPAGEDPYGGAETWYRVYFH